MEWLAGYHGDVDRLITDEPPAALAAAAIGPELAAAGPAWLRRADRPLTGSEVASLVHAAALLDHDDGETACRVLDRGPVALVGGMTEEAPPWRLLVEASGAGGAPDPVLVARSSGASADEAIEGSPCYWAVAAGGEGARRKHRSSLTTVPFFGRPGRLILEPWQWDGTALRFCMLLAATLEVLRPAWTSPGPMADDAGALRLAEAILPQARVDRPGGGVEAAVERALHWGHAHHVDDVLLAIDALDDLVMEHLACGYVLADRVAAGAVSLDPAEESALLALMPEPRPDDAWRWAGRADGGEPWWRSGGRRPPDLADLHWFAWLLDAWARRLGRRFVGLHADRGGLVRYQLSGPVS